MKDTKFFWQWEEYRPQPDPLMTRQRAARLLRSWRRARTQGRRVFHISCVRIERMRTYLVRHLATGERAGLCLCCEINEQPGVPVPLKDGGQITINAVPAPQAFSSLTRMEHGQPIALVATNEQGEEVGRLIYMPNGGPIDSFVREQDRRRRIASALYDAYEAAGGELPSEARGAVISDEARSLRKSRAKAVEALGSRGAR